MTKQNDKPTLQSELAALNAGKDAIVQAAARFPHERERLEKCWKEFQADPLSLTLEQAKKLQMEISANATLCESFEEQDTNRLVREYEARFYRERVKTITEALNAELEGKLLPRQGFLENLRTYVSDISKRVFAPTLTVEQSEQLLAERDKREDRANELEKLVRSARQAISYFSLHPSEEALGGVTGILSAINYSQTVSK